MLRSYWDFEQHARHTERAAMAEAERARQLALVPAAERGGRGIGLGFVAWLRAGGARVEAWVAGTPRQGAPAPAPCHERAV